MATNTFLVLLNYYFPLCPPIKELSRAGEALTVLDLATTSRAREDSQTTQALPKAKTGENDYRVNDHTWQLELLRTKLHFPAHVLKL